MSVSWSELKTFMNCPTAWYLQYVVGVKGKSKESVARVAGSVFHEGLYTHLLGGEWRPAVQGFHNELYDGSQTEEDIQAIVEGYETAVNALRYYIPLMGDRYRVAMSSELLDDMIDAPMLEWPFEVDGIKGHIDAILYDTQLDEFCVVDWKLRAAIPYDDAMQADGQLRLYVNAINTISKVPVTRAIMWTFKSHTPSPASISKRDGLPNTGAASYDTTWDYWCATLPAGIDADKYESIMRPKLKQASDFMRAVEIIITPQSCDTIARSLKTSVLTMNFVRDNIEDVRDVPAVRDLHVCKMCQFVNLCSAEVLHGMA